MNPEFYEEFNAQRDLQQAQIDAETRLNAPGIMQNQQAVQAALVEQINPVHVLKQIQLQLRGQMEDPYTGEIQQISEPLMNEVGTGNMLVLASSVVNQNTIMSSFDEKEINKMILQLGEDITDDLTMNWKEYGIKDKTKLDVIEDIVLFMSYSSLKRALSGGERRFLGTTTVESINTAPRMMPQKKEGFLSRFKI